MVKMILCAGLENRQGLRCYSCLKRMSRKSAQDNTQRRIKTTDHQEKFRHQLIVPHIPIASANGLFSRSKHLNLAPFRLVDPELEPSSKKTKTLVQSLEAIVEHDALPYGLVFTSAFLGHGIALLRVTSTNNHTLAERHLPSSHVHLSDISVASYAPPSHACQ